MADEESEKSRPSLEPPSLFGSRRSKKATGTSGAAPSPALRPDDSSAEDDVARAAREEAERQQEARRAAAEAARVEKAQAAAAARAERAEAKQAAAQERAEAKRAAAAERAQARSVAKERKAEQRQLETERRTAEAAEAAEAAETERARAEQDEADRVEAQTAAAAASAERDEKAESEEPESERTARTEPATELAAADDEPDEGDERPTFTDSAIVAQAEPERSTAAVAPAPADQTDAVTAATTDGDDIEELDPILSGKVAAVLVGVLVGVILVGLTLGGSATCGAVGGAGGCGFALGAPLLIAIVALSMVAGRFLLQFFYLPEPGSTSFMAVALLAIVTVLFLLDVLDSWITLTAIPIASGLAFLAAWWLTTSFEEPDSVRRTREDPAEPTQADRQDA